MTLLYFVAMTDLSLVQIGSALSLSALLTMPGAFVIGSLVDRLLGAAFGALRGLVLLLAVAAVVTRNTRRIRLYLASNWPSAQTFAHAMSQLRSP